MQGVGDFPQPTSEEIKQANSLKEEGNGLMKTSQFEAAVAKYSEAIKLNKDPAYFCNRYYQIFSKFLGTFFPVAC